MASHQGKNKLKRSQGTSFAAPIIAHHASILHNKYPDFTNNTIKGLLIHFAEGIPDSEDDYELARCGFGLTNIEEALYSYQTRATMIYEGKIRHDTEKIIKFPVPPSLKGSHRKRMRINYTLVYNPPINIKDPNFYNPIFIGADLISPDGRRKSTKFNNNRLGGKYKKSNVKRYPAIEVSTKKNMNDWWHFSVKSETKREFLPEEHTDQDFSLIVSIKDLNNDPNIDLVEELINTIDAEIKNIVEAELSL
jgi:hypothetical protein